MVYTGEYPVTTLMGRGREYILQIRNGAVATVPPSGTGWAMVGPRSP